MTWQRVWRIGLLIALLGGVSPQPAWAIPVFARVYGKPCSACHTIYPQLNPAGEYFRATGLHSMEPVIKPVEIGSEFAVPGTLPLALALGVGEDVTHTHVPARTTPTTTHFNLEFLSLLAGGELGRHLAFMADYTPWFAIAQTGELKENNRLGLGFLQAHFEPAAWLVNLRVGLQELPVGTSPRVHRLSQQSYLLYGLTAFSLLGKQQPGSANSLTLSSTQTAAEVSGLDPASGHSFALGVSTGSNNRLDNNDAQAVYGRVGQAFALHRVGLFVYYSPNVLAHGADDSVVRVGPDVNLFFRQAGLRGQFLAGHDSNPTGLHEDFWYYGAFVEGEYRWIAALASLARVEYAWTPTFDDRNHGGKTDVRRRLWQLIGGTQWLPLENLKLVAEASYGQNEQAISKQTTESWAVTVRMLTAFWPLTPPGFESWMSPRPGRL